MSHRDDYFARVEPILGSGLAHVTLGVRGPAVLGDVLELLSACRLERIVALDPEAPSEGPLYDERRGIPRRPGDDPTVPPSAWERLGEHLRWKNGFAPARILPAAAATPDFVVVGRVLHPSAPAQVSWAPGERRVTVAVPRGDRFAHRQVSYHVARDLRDGLLGRAPFPEGTFFYGDARWPFAVGRQRPADAAPTPLDAAGAHVAVIGCGSLGSEVIRLLCRTAGRLSLVDGATVSVFNPHRQWFGTDDIGAAKVECLARRLEPQTVRSLRRHVGPTDLEELLAWLDADRPDLVLLTTGTSDDAPVARALWERGVPHIAAYAYPQARFFEVSVMDPTAGTPCLHCLRGHVFAGAAAAPPVTDEVAGFLYRDISASERDVLYQNLVAEPATPIETHRIADVVALCATELLRAPEDRHRWMRRALEEHTTCLLGGNVVEARGDGWAYGLTVPGQVVRLGTGDIAGATPERLCGVCGRRLRTTYDTSLPHLDDAEVDAALLA